MTVKTILLLVVAGGLAGTVSAQPYPPYYDPGIYAPAPPPVPRYAYARPVMPGPGYFWVDGYWNFAGGQYLWVGGFWRRPPYAGGYWVSPRYSGGRYFAGYWGGPRGYRNGYYGRGPAVRSYSYGYRGGGGGYHGGYRGGYRGGRR